MTDIDRLISSSAAWCSAYSLYSASYTWACGQGTDDSLQDNTTGTSFVSALSTVSYLIEGGEY